MPVQVPGRAVSVCPTVAVPVTVGGLRVGRRLAAAVTTAVAAELAWLVPAVLVAVTVTLEGGADVGCW